MHGSSGYFLRNCHLIQFVQHADRDASNAKLIGIEYIIPAETFEKLPPEVVQLTLACFPCMLCESPCDVCSML